MGITRGGILGAFRKKVGNAVGAVVGGQNVIRQLPSHYFDKKSESQQLQRRTFKKTVKVFQTIAPFVKATNLERKAKHSAYNVFVKSNSNVSIVDENVDYANLNISSGSLATNTATTETKKNNTNIVLKWEDNTDNISAFADDDVNVCVINTADENSFMKIAVAKRKDKTVTITTPANFDKKECRLYLSFTNKKTNKSSKASNGRCVPGSELSGTVQ